MKTDAFMDKLNFIIILINAIVSFLSQPVVLRAGSQNHSHMGSNSGWPNARKVHYLLDSFHCLENKDPKRLNNIPKPVK